MKQFAFFSLGNHPPTILSFSFSRYFSSFSLCCLSDAQQNWTWFCHRRAGCFTFSRTVSRKSSNIAGSAMNADETQTRKNRGWIRTRCVPYTKNGPAEGFRRELGSFQGLVIIEWASVVSPWDFETVLVCTKRDADWKVARGKARESFAPREEEKPVEVNFLPMPAGGN